MTPPILKLVKGSKTLNLNDLSEYFLTADFVPPAVNRVPNFAEGSSANRYGGAALISTRSINRQFSFTVQIRGDSDREMQRAMNNIEYMLSQAGDPVEPLYLKYKANSDVAYEPLWGQDGWLTYIVEHGIAVPMPSYSNINRRSVNLEAQLNLALRPYAIGLRQRLASATGGVIEDTIGMVDGQSRGLVISLALTNKFTNPIFGHATFDNGWTTLSSLISAQNTNPNFVLFGQNSVKLTCKDALGNNVFYQSLTLTVAVYTLSFYVKRIDGAAVTSSDVTIDFADSNQTPIFNNVGNGWYRATFTGTATAAPGAYGVIVLFGRTIYVDGFQIELFAYATPLFYGDLLGCAWTGTAHASTSTRTAGRVSIAASDSINLAQGTFRIVVRFNVSNAYTQPMYLMDTTGYIFRFYFLGSDKKFYFTDGTNTVSTAAQTFSVGTIYIIHATYLPGTGLIIYINGSSAATSATYTPPLLPTNMFIGSDPTDIQGTQGTILDFTTFDRAMTATEVATDYANIAQVTAHNQRVGCVPWLWTKDGDDVVDNANDDTTRNNFAVCSGIPGSAPTETEINATLSVATGTFTEIYMSNLASDVFVPIQQSSVQYTDLSGSTDSNSSGSAYRAQSVSTTGIDVTNSTGITGTGFAKYLFGREYILVTRLTDLGSASPVSLAAVVTGTADVTTDYLQAATSASAGIYATPPFVLAGLENRVHNPGDNILSNFQVYLYAKRTTGSASINVDYIALLPRPFMVLKSASAGVTATLRYKGRKAHTGSPATAVISPNIPVIGDVIELVPNRINTLISFMNDVNATITRTLTYSSVYVTPRWSLL